MRRLRNRHSGARGMGRGLSLLLLLAFALSTGAARAGEIRGRLLVSDRADKPVGGLTVSAVPWETPGDEARRAMKGSEVPKPIASAVTGADGAFVLAVPSEPGKEKTFRVRVEGAGVVPVLFEDVYDAAETEDLGEHTLPHGERVTGVAVDASGKPLAGAEVSLEAGVAGDDDLAFRVVTRKVVTGEDGRFQFEEASARGNRITIERADLAPTLQTGLKAGTIPRPIVVVAGDPITGTVVDAGKHPVASALARLESLKATTRWVETDTEGRFTIPHAPDGRGSIVVDAGDAGWGRKPDVKLPLGEGKALAITLARPASLEGTVVADKTGHVVPRAKVLLKANNFARLGGASTRPRTKTAADGTFLIKGMSVGEYALQIRKPGFANERVDPVKVTEKGVDPIAVTLGPGASLSGIVRRKNGDGAEGFIVRVGGGGGRGAGGGILGGLGTDLATASDGLFVIDGLKPGQAYNLSVFGGAGLGPQKRGVVAPATNVEMVVAGTGRIAGTALDARSGQPLKNFSVSFEPDRGGGAIIRIVARGAGAQTGIGQKRDFDTDDGSFTLEDVPAGTWTVVVEAKGYQPARVANLLVEENGVKDGVEVRATPGMVLKGHVTDARSGRPVANANITYQATDSGGGPGGGFGGRGGAISGLDPSQDITSDADGHFEIEGIPTGKVKVTAKNPNYTDGSEVADVKDTGGTVEIKLTGGGSASGIVALGSQPLPNAQVALAGAGDAGFGRILGGSQTTTSDGQGHFEFDHLGAGRYTVSAGLNGQSSNLTDFVLQAGDSKNDIVLSLSGGSTIQGAVSGLPDNWKNGTTVTANGAQAFVASTKVGGDGTFQITNVPAGPVTLRAQAGDGLGDSRSATKLVTASDDVPVLPAEIVFDVGFNLTGHVTQAGQPTANAMVLASLQGGGGRQATTRTDSSGAYTLQGLQEGSY